MISPHDCSEFMQYYKQQKSKSRQAASRPDSKAKRTMRLLPTLVSASRPNSSTPRPSTSKQGESEQRNVAHGCSHTAQNLFACLICSTIFPCHALSIRGILCLLAIHFISSIDWRQANDNLNTPRELILHELPDKVINAAILYHPPYVSLLDVYGISRVTFTSR